MRKLAIVTDIKYNNQPVSQLCSDANELFIKSQAVMSAKDASEVGDLVSMSFKTDQQLDTGMVHQISTDLDNILISSTSINESPMSLSLLEAMGYLFPYDTDEAYTDKNTAIPVAIADASNIIEGYTPPTPVLNAESRLSLSVMTQDWQQLPITVTDDIPVVCMFNAMTNQLLTLTNNYVIRKVGTSIVVTCDSALGDDAEVLTSILLKVLFKYEE